MLLVIDELWLVHQLVTLLLQGVFFVVDDRHGVVVEYEKMADEV